MAGGFFCRKGTNDNLIFQVFSVIFRALLRVLRTGGRIGLSGCLSDGLQGSLKTQFRRNRSPERPSETAKFRRAFTPSPAPQARGRVGEGVAVRRTAFAAAARKHCRSGTSPHPSPPPRAGEGTRLPCRFQAAFQTACEGRLKTQFRQTQPPQGRPNRQPETLIVRRT